MATNSSLPVIIDVMENNGVRYLMVTLHLIVIILASVGNCFLFVFLIRNWKQTRKNVTAILILNLAMCDFINVTIHQPMMLVDLLVSHEENVNYCKVSAFFGAFLSGVGFLLIVAISQERLLLIRFPFRAKSLLTMKNTVIVMVCIWVGVGLCALPLPIGFVTVLSVMFKGGETSFCLLNLDHDSSANIRVDVYFGFMFVIYFLGPLVIITASYGSIFRRLYKEVPGEKSGNVQAVTRAHQQRKSVAKIMLSIAVIFVVSHGPYWLTSFIVVCGYEIPKNQVFTMMFVELLTMLSPVMNPIVYSIKRRTMRKGLTHGGSIYNALKRMSSTAQTDFSSTLPSALTSNPDSQHEFVPILEKPKRNSLQSKPKALQGEKQKLRMSAHDNKKLYHHSQYQQPSKSKQDRDREQVKRQTSTVTPGRPASHKHSQRTTAQDKSKTQLPTKSADFFPSTEIKSRRDNKYPSYIPDGKTDKGGTSHSLDGNQHQVIFRQHSPSSHGNDKQRTVHRQTSDQSSNRHSAPSTAIRVSVTSV